MPHIYTLKQETSSDDGLECENHLEWNISRISSQRLETAFINYNSVRREEESLLILANWCVRRLWISQLARTKETETLLKRPERNERFPLEQPHPSNEKVRRIDYLRG